MKSSGKPDKAKEPKQLTSLAQTFRIWKEGGDKALRKELMRKRKLKKTLTKT